MDPYGPTEIVLHDLACTKNVCFSPAVWKIRMMLNYKKIPYSTCFLEFPDIDPIVQELFDEVKKCTVPTIIHVPSDEVIMDSAAIAKFLETAYPDPPVDMTSELVLKVQADGRCLVGGVLSASVMPREINILSAESQEYFRRTREATLGHPLEDLLKGDREDKAWLGMDKGVRAVGELLLINKDKGPFVLGAKVSYADFFIAGALQCARVIDEAIFERMIAYPGYERIYNACQPFMERKD